MNIPANAARVRIYSHMTQSRFLHIEDSLAINKVRLFAGAYRKNKGMSTYANAFVNIADARVIFGALARGEQGFRHKEYKGTPPRNGKTAVSRGLSIAVKGENVYIELKTGPGKLTDTGAITPDGKAKVEVNVSFKLYEARRMAASVLAYIHAWDVVRMMVNQEMISKPSPYTLVPATSASNNIRAMPTNGVSKSNGAVKSPAALAHNGRNSSPQLWRYGDGTPVAADNLTECNTYLRYRQAKGTPPPSKRALQQFYRQQTAV